jgi:hypothetical protein
MTMRFSLGRPDIQWPARWRGRPILGGTRSPVRGRRDFGIREAGRRRAGVPRT